MNPLFRGLSRSLQVELDGSPRSYSLLEDFERHLREQGALRDGESLLARSDLQADIQAEWHRQGQNGCLFASMLADKREQCGWTFVSLPGTAGWNGDDWRREVGQRVVDGTKDPNRWILSFLFPDVVDLPGVKRLLAALGTIPNWRLSELADEHGKKTAREEQLYLKLRIRVADGHVVPPEFIDAGEESRERVVDVDSWPLFFTNLDHVPVTRRAPFTEFSVALKPKAFKPPPELSDDWEAAHLADVPAPIDSTEAFQSFLANTKALKRRLLGAEGYLDLAASAKVTFAVPRSAWDAA